MQQVTNRLLEDLELSYSSRLFVQGSESILLSEIIL